MSSPDQGHKSDSTSLDAERARLRSAGYTDAEVSQILIARVSQQPAGATAQGALSNALSSIVAVGSHARALLPTFRNDVATVFDGDATVSERAGATASLAVKAVVILVLGYAAWQEWHIHIIYATETAHQQLLKTTYDATGAQWQTAKAAPIHFGDTSAPIAPVAPVADNYALCMESNHDYDSRIKACSNIVARGEAETKENRAFAYTNRALAYLDLGDRPHMLEDVNQAIDLDDKSAEAYNTRAIAYATEDPARALADFTRAINLKPNEALYYRNRARLYSKQFHDDAKAQADLDQAKRLAKQ